MLVGLAQSASGITMKTVSNAAEAPNLETTQLEARCKLLVQASFDTMASDGNDRESESWCAGNDRRARAIPPTKYIQLFTG